MIEEASNDLSDVDCMVMLFDDGYSSFFYIKWNFTKECGWITKSLPWKKSNMMEIYNKKIVEFD